MGERLKHHYWRNEDKNCLSNIKSNDSIPVLLPNASTITAEQQGTLPISQHLSKKAKETLILPNLKSASLISLGQLYDDGCKVELEKKS